MPLEPTTLEEALAEIKSWLEEGGGTTIIVHLNPDEETMDIRADMACPACRILALKRALLMEVSAHGPNPDHVVPSPDDEDTIGPVKGHG